MFCSLPFNFLSFANKFSGSFALNSNPNESKDVVRKRDLKKVRALTPF